MSSSTLTKTSETRNISFKKTPFIKEVEISTLKSTSKSFEHKDNYKLKKLNPLGQCKRRFLYSNILKKPVVLLWTWKIKEKCTPGSDLIGCKWVFLSHPILFFVGWGLMGVGKGGTYFPLVPDFCMQDLHSSVYKSDTFYSIFGNSLKMMCKRNSVGAFEPTNFG